MLVPPFFQGHTSAWTDCCTKAEKRAFKFKCIMWLGLGHKVYRDVRWEDSEAQRPASRRKERGTETSVGCGTTSGTTPKTARDCSGSRMRRSWHAESVRLGGAFSVQIVIGWRMRKNGYSRRCMSQIPVVSGDSEGKRRRERKRAFEVGKGYVKLNLADGGRHDLYYFPQHEEYGAPTCFPPQRKPQRSGCRYLLVLS